MSSLDKRSAINPGEKWFETKCVGVTELNVSRSRRAKVNAPSPDPESAHTPPFLEIAFFIRLICSTCCIRSVIIHYMKLAVLLGSTRPNYRLGERVAKWVMSETTKYSQAMFTFLDLRDYHLPFFNEEQGPRGNKNRQPSTNVSKWLRDMEAADGYIFITPEYNEGPSAALKNAIDFLAFEGRRKPAIITGYSDGSNGGMYAPIQLRVNLGELEIVALKKQQIILNADKVLSEEGIAISGEKVNLERRFAGIIDEILWFAHALKTAREKDIQS